VDARAIDLHASPSWRLPNGRERRNADHRMLCDLLVLRSGWPDLNRRPLRPELAAPLGVWPSLQLDRCAGGCDGCRLTGDGFQRVRNSLCNTAVTCARRLRFVDDARSSRVYPACSSASTALAARLVFYMAARADRDAARRSVHSWSAGLSVLGLSSSAMPWPTGAGDAQLDI
jgi:hypothetical protein